MKQQLINDYARAVHLHINNKNYDMALELIELIKKLEDDDES